jgi:hypothetical protein
MAEGRNNLADVKPTAGLQMRRKAQGALKCKAASAGLFRASRLGFRLKV